MNSEKMFLFLIPAVVIGCVGTFFMNQRGPKVTYRLLQTQNQTDYQVFGREDHKDYVLKHIPTGEYFLVKPNAPASMLYPPPVETEKEMVFEENKM